MTTVSRAIKNAFKKREDLTFTFFLEKTFPAFEGHFPGAPILPAIAQIEIALFCVRMLLGKNVFAAEIKRAKFVKPVLPDSEIEAVLGENSGESFHVIIKGGKEVYSQIHFTVS